MDGVFFGHTHYIPPDILNDHGIKIGAVLVPEFYPDLVYRYYNEVQYFRTVSAFTEFARTKLGRVSPLFFSIENIRMLSAGDSIAELKKLGVCSIQLFHHGDNLFFSRNTGLSENGLRLLHEMERESIFLDLSHLNDDWIHQILNVFDGKVMVSHCAVSELLEHAECRSNRVSMKTLDRLIKRDALIGLSFVNDTVSFHESEQDECNVYRSILHQIQYLVKSFGYDHFCIAPDYFDASYYSAVFSEKLFIPSIFYSSCGYHKLYSDLILALKNTKGAKHFFWSNLELRLNHRE